MKKGTIAALLFIFVVIPLMYGLKQVLPVLHSKMQKQTSDAKDVRGKITVAYDDWIGYFPLTSPRMKKFLRSEGYLLNCINDGGDYAARMKALEEGKYDFAVVTVDSYILNAARVNFPGTIITILDESKGADAIVAYTNVVKDLDSFQNEFHSSIAYTENSPSDFLLKAVPAHFNVPALRNLSEKQRLKTKDSQEAFKMLQEKKADVAVLWEPNVSKALKIPGVGRILGTESTSRLIVDILVVNRDFASKHPEKVDLMLKTYFRVLKFYASDPEELKKDIHTELKLPEESIQKMLDGVAWINLSENCCEWFGISGPGQVARQGLVDTIESAISILVDNGDFKQNPLPDKDPYRIINSQFIQDIYKEGVQNGFTALMESGNTNNSVSVFKPLSDAQWLKLHSVGSIRVDPIVFQMGAASLDVEQKEKLDAAMERLNHYPSFRILVGGHTSLLGDLEANRNLSQQRAESVARYLSVTYNIDENRIKAIGHGGEKPLPKLKDESDRAYNYRLPRVQISLLEESF
ncbi:MAG: phosphate ABC transporter substrate-binding/OmpA family protein [Candidatus Paceibacterota bacterium]|jgi:outer membrane protein OmpA-like peptidoglycan-associated protein/ABC-type nitrate/sulfonate/bicarbonate transport system substrate-binding protein